MTATAAAPAPARDTHLPASEYRLTFPRVLRAEAIKLTTLRSTWWSLAIAAVMTVGIALMVASAVREFAPGFSPVNAVLMPTQFTMLVAGILGAIAITGEYSTGMIRASLTAEPRRGAVLLAKAVAVGVLVALATAVTSVLAIAATAPVFGDAGIDWSDPAASWIPLAYGVLAMVSFALIGTGWGFIVRNSAGAIAATVGVLFVLPLVVSMFSLAGEGWRWVLDAGDYLPMNAAQALMTSGGTDVTGQLLAVVAWPVGLLLIGWAVLRTRDA